MTRVTGSGGQLAPSSRKGTTEVKTLLADMNSPPPNGGNQPAWVGHVTRRTARAVKLAGAFALGAVVLCVPGAIAGFGQQDLPANSIPNVKCIIGCENFKTDAKGALSVLPSGLEFATEKDKADITTASITDIFTGNESRQDVTGAAQVMSMGIPYGGSRILSLFSHEVEVLTVEYADSNGGFHGAIFVLPAGKATSFKNQLVAQGAKTSTHVQPQAPEVQKP